MARKFNRGDIVFLEHDPAAGREMKGGHFALVVSNRDFHSLGLHWVCPISQGAAEHARSRGYLITLMGAGTETQGCVHVHQLKSLDLDARKAQFKESLCNDVVEEVLEALRNILE